MPSSLILETLSSYDSSSSAEPTMRLRIGIDSYSYHRLLGGLRPGEAEPPRSVSWGAPEVAGHARALGVDGLSLETCFLGRRAGLDAGALRDAAGPLELVFAWGHPDGLEFGASTRALRDLLSWLELAAELGCTLVRCVAAGPRLRGRAPVTEQIGRTVRPLAAAAASARGLGLTLALENHGDLRAADLLELVGRVGDPALAVCFDTANALRVGDDPVEAAALLAPLTRMVHLKDVEPVDRVADLVAGPCSVPYGEGVVPVAAVLDVLLKAGFDGLACVELGQLAAGSDELELVERCVAWLRAYASSKG
jgi:sugar phosphate isomerase/epimerase